MFFLKFTNANWKQIYVTILFGWHFSSVNGRSHSFLIYRIPFLWDGKHFPLLSLCHAWNVCEYHITGFIFNTASSISDVVVLFLFTWPVIFSDLILEMYVVHDLIFLVIEFRVSKGKPKKLPLSFVSLACVMYLSFLRVTGESEVFHA